jgi:hypothetical protein
MDNFDHKMGKLIQNLLLTVIHVRLSDCPARWSAQLTA